MGTVTILGMSTTVMGAEAVIVVVIVALLVGILITSRRRKQPAAQPAPQQPSANYYAGLEQKQGGQPDPFASLTAAPGGAHGNGPANGQPTNGAATNGQDAHEPAPAAVPAYSAAATAPSPAPAAEPAPGAPPPPAPAPVPPAGTPAGWLPDPGGAPDTLRYWDGNAWTPHFAQRA